MKTAGCAVALLLGLLFSRAGSSAALPLHDEPREDGVAGKGWLGVSIQDMTPELARSMHIGTESGALISDVTEDSPAERAGLKEEDVIVTFDGKVVENADDLRVAVRRTAPGSRVAIVVARHDNRTSLEVKVGKQPRALAAPFAPPTMLLPRPFPFGLPDRHGLKLRTLEQQLGEYFQAPDGRGVLVVDVEEGSDAGKAGFQAGDVIVRAGKERVENVRDVRRAIRNAEKDATLAFAILRRGSNRELTLTITKHPSAGMFRFRSGHGWGGWHLDGKALKGLELDLEHLEDMKEN
jgi:serine protease Do